MVNPLKMCFAKYPQEKEPGQGKAVNCRNDLSLSTSIQICLAELNYNNCWKYHRYKVLIFSPLSEGHSQIGVNGGDFMA